MTIDEEDFKALTSMDSNEWDPATIKLFTDICQHFDKRIKKLELKVDRYSQSPVVIARVVTKTAINEFFRKAVEYSPQIAVALAVLWFLVYVWPTPSRYEKTSFTSGHGIKSEAIIRTNRFSGKSEEVNITRNNR